MEFPALPVEFPVLPVEFTVLHVEYPVPPGELNALPVKFTMLPVESLEFMTVFNVCKSSYFRVIDTAARQLTKTAITVTAIFIVSLGFDLWYYVLGYSGVTEYKMNTPMQKIGTLVISIRC